LQKLAIETCGERPENLYIGKGNGYVDLTFSPSSFSKMFTSPNPYFHSKDHDFLLGVKLIAHILPSESVLNQAQGEDIIVPAVAIECKTYLERNMLDSCAGTASRLKRAMPYCIYVVATEYLKLEVSQPELTDIDEIFVLCKASNAQRLEHRRLGQPLHPIDATLILELYNMVRSHINRVWWSPENALKDGKIINRPVIC
jgi:hypothetical protein